MQALPWLVASKTGYRHQFSAYDPCRAILSGDLSTPFCRRSVSSPTLNTNHSALTTHEYHNTIQVTTTISQIYSKPATRVHSLLSKVIIITAITRYRQTKSTMDQSRDNSKTATGSAIALESDSADISSDSESAPSSSPIKTKAIVQGAHSNSWATEYPPRNLKYAVEHMGIFPPGDENVDKENLKYIISKSNDSEPPATPRPLPMNPVVHAKGNDDGLEKIQARHAFGDLLGNMIGLVQSGGVALKPGRDGAAANSASPKSEAVRSSLSYLLPGLAEKRGIGSKETDQQEYNWVDKAMGHDKAEAAARMERFLAGGDELIAINDQPIIDLDKTEAQKPKKKKKNKISSKKRKQLRARKASLEGSLTAAEDEAEHNASQNTINETAKHTSLAGASTSAEHEHDISYNATDEKANKAALESPSTSAKHEHHHDASQYTADEKAKETSMEGASTSDEQDTPQNTTDEMSETYIEEKSKGEKHSKKTPSEGAPTPPEHDFDENTADEQSELHGNDNPEDRTTSAEDDTLQYTPQDTPNEISEIRTNKRLPDEQKAFADAMTDAAVRMVTTSKKGKEKMNAPVLHMATHDAGASVGFTEQELTNITEFMNFFNSKIELHDRFFAEMKGLIQSFVTELRGLPDLQSKYGKVIEDLRTVFRRLHDLDTRARMNAHNIRNSQASSARATVNKNDVSSAEMEETGLEIFRGMKKDTKQLVPGGGGATERQSVASRVGKCQRELDEVVIKLDADIAQYAEINNKLQGSINTVKNDIIGLQRTSKVTTSELAEVGKTVRDLDKNVRAIRGTLNQIVQAAHNVPILQQASAKYDHAMKEIGNVSAECDRLEKIVDYNRDAVKKGNDEILGSLDKQAKRLNNCHGIVTKTRDTVRGHADHLNTLNNKVSAHQKLIAKLTAQSDSNARRLHSLSDTTARDIKALSESTFRDIKSLVECTSREIKETFDQLKETQVQLGTLKANVDFQAGAIAEEYSFDEQKIKDIVMTLLDPIASEVDKLCEKVEAYLSPLDHISPTSDRPPKPRKLSFAQKHSQKKALAAARPAVEAQQTATQPTGVANDAVHGDIPDASQAAKPEIKVPKVRMPQIDSIRSASLSGTPAAASPAPIAPHPSPPGNASVAGHSPPAMQILKRPEQRRSSLARNERHPQDGPLPERVVAERRNSMQRRDSTVFRNSMAGPGMMSPMVMDRVMMAPQNAYEEIYGDLVVAQQQQVAYTQQQMVAAPQGLGSPQIFGDEYGQQQYVQQYDQQQYGQQHHDQFGQEMRYSIGHPLAIIPVDENIPPAPYIPQEDPRDNHIMLLTYNVDNLNARVNEATNAMSVAQSSIRNFRTQYRYEISQEVEREVERAMGREVVRMETRINQNLDRRMNNTGRRLSDRTSREAKMLKELLPQLEELLRREGLEVPLPGEKLR